MYLIICFILATRNIIVQNITEDIFNPVHTLQILIDQQLWMIVQF